MEEYRKLLEEILNRDLLWMVFSGPKQPQAAVKVRVRPLAVKGDLRYQAAFWDGKKETHINYKKEDLIEAAAGWMETDYRQMQAETAQVTASVLVSKKERYREEETAAPGFGPGGTVPQPEKAPYSGRRNSGAVPGGAGSDDPGGKGGKQPV